MKLSLVGINYRTAPLYIREKVAVSIDRLPDCLKLLYSQIGQGIVLSTCNRTEIYMATNSQSEVEKGCMDFYCQRLDVTEKQLSKYIYIYKETEAIRHLFRIAGGLESMIIGEYEVLGQIKQALEASETAGMVNLPLRHVFHSAFRTGRNIREETGISKNALSVSSVAVDLATKVIGDIDDAKLLIIGAGEAGRLVGKVAYERGIKRIVIANRKIEKAEYLADVLHGVPVGLNSLGDEIKEADIVVTCASAPHRILDFQKVSVVMKSRRKAPLVIVDIAIPRNVDPSVKDIPNVFLYDIDNLTEISEANRKLREDEIHKVEDIIEAEVEKCWLWWNNLAARPLVTALMSKAEEIRTTQLKKTLKKMPPLKDEEIEYLDAMTKSISTKLLKDAIQYIQSNPQDEHIDRFKQIFNLKNE